MIQITVLDGYALNPGDLSWKEFENLGNVTVYNRTSPSELMERAKDADVLINNKTVLDAESINSLPKLKYIGVLATGYNVVDLETARKRNIPVTNIPAYSTLSVAQHVFALLLAVTDRVEHYALETQKGRWSNSRDFCYWNTPLVELAGKNFGIIGLGNIGMAVAKIAVSLGMKVLAFTSKDAEHLPDGIKKVELNDLFSQSDVISLHCPLNDSTREIINSETISKMKRGVIIINTGRGPLVNEKAVADGLKSGHIAAFCADVLSTEPPSSDNPLLSAPNTYITPHIAWATKEARNRLMEIAYLNLKGFMDGSLQNVVNGL